MQWCSEGCPVNDTTILCADECNGNVSYDLPQVLPRNVNAMAEVEAIWMCEMFHAAAVYISIVQIKEEWIRHTSLPVPIRRAVVFEVINGLDYETSKLLLAAICTRILSSSSILRHLSYFGHSSNYLFPNTALNERQSQDQSTKQRDFRSRIFNLSSSTEECCMQESNIALHSTRRLLCR